MTKNIIIGFLFLIGMTSFTGCNKFLDVKPQNGIINQDFWKTKEQVEGAVIGVYISLVESTVVKKLFNWGELRADMIALAPPPSKPSADERLIIEGNILSTNAVAAWAPVYKVINNCNLVIDNAARARDTDPTFSLLQLNNKLAEVKTIRALLYFYLVRTYGEVPLQLDGVDEDTQIVSLAKSSQQVVLNQILEDLAFAEINALETFGNTTADKGRITKWSALALKADVLLWMDDFAAANVVCDQIINSKRFGLVEGTEEEFFNTLFFNGNSAESIFEFQYSVDYLNPFYNTFYSSRSFIANTESMDSFFPKDMLTPLVVDLRGEGVAYNATDLTVWKYIGKNATEARTAAESTANYPIYRFAEILLMKAEALAYTNRGSEALVEIQKIRTRAKALVLTEQPVDGSSGPAAIMEYILAERAREFAFEGKRWFDVLRYAKRNNYENKSYLIGVATVNTPSNLRESSQIRLQDVNSHYLPVPFKDIQSNKNMIQNPFYQ